MKFTEAYTYDDLMLVPKYSTIRSRKQPDVSTRLGTLNLEVPIVSAPMNTITEGDMLHLMRGAGGAAVMHRFISPEDQAIMIGSPPRYGTFAAIGVDGAAEERAEILYAAGVRNFCIDAAFGNNELSIDAVKTLRGKFDFPINIMAGNVCTREGAERLVEAGANIIRVGIGPGSMCKTRLVTGHGVPQLTAINDCQVEGAFVVADGGIRSSGDIVKALAMGADAVMIGGLLAGSAATPGQLYVDMKTGEQYKVFHGMASEAGRENWFGADATQFVPEGETTTVPYKGDTRPIIDNLVGGLRVGLSISGAKNLRELRQTAEWVRVTDNGRIEGTPNRKMFR